MRLNEIQIKRLLLEHLRSTKSINPKSVIASEFVVASSGNRIDLAIWNGEFIGVEIKSEFDTLRRLEAQYSSYTKCFDRVIVVASEKHIADAISILPKDAEIWNLAQSGHFIIPPEIASQSALGKSELIRMLTLHQLRKLVGSTAGIDMPRSQMRTLAEELPTAYIRDAVTSSFKSSFSATSARFWEIVGRRKVQTSHLNLLSRTQTKRSEELNERNANTEFWNRWNREAELYFNNAA